jgi:diguanylate cyclase (GGDEF)-like protein
MRLEQVQRDEHLLSQVRSTRWWVWLPPELRSRFQTRRNLADLRSSRLAVVCAILVFNSFVFTDAGLIPDAFELSVWTRVGVLTPLALLYVPLAARWVRRDPSTVRHHLYASVFATALIAWVCVLQVTTRSPTGMTYFMGCYLVVIFYAVAIRGPLAVRVPTMVAMFVVFAVAMPFSQVTSAPLRIDAILCMLGFMAFGVLGSHREESTARERFVLGCRADILEARREQELDQLATANELLARQASRDALTGVPNRRAINDVMAGWSVGPVTSGALLVIDLDHFKAYNDSAGHQAGDEVLRRVARVMADSMRDDELMLARYGGEEFVAVLRGLGPDDARRAAERLRLAVESLRIPVPAGARGTTQPYVSVSVGGAWTASSSLCSADELLGLADSALYAAKDAGRNAVCFAPLVDGTRPLGDSAETAGPVAAAG